MYWAGVDLWETPVESVFTQILRKVRHFFGYFYKFILNLIQFNLLRAKVTTINNNFINSDAI